MDVYTDFVKGDLGLMSGGSKESNDSGEKEKDKDKVRFLIRVYRIKGHTRHSISGIYRHACAVIYLEIYLLSSTLLSRYL